MSEQIPKVDTAGLPRPPAAGAGGPRRAPGCLGVAIALFFAAGLLFGAGALFALVLEHLARH
jgi:hypothetical protein